MTILLFEFIYTTTCCAHHRIGHKKNVIHYLVVVGSKSKKEQNTLWQQQKRQLRKHQLRKHQPRKRLLKKRLLLRSRRKRNSSNFQPTFVNHLTAHTLICDNRRIGQTGRHASCEVLMVEINLPFAFFQWPEVRSQGLAIELQAKLWHLTSGHLTYE